MKKLNLLFRFFIALIYNKLSVIMFSLVPAITFAIGSVSTSLAQQYSMPLQSAVTQQRQHHYRKALKLFMPLAKKGNKIALNSVGYLYSYGLGVKLDYHKAMHYFRLAYQAGNAYAAENIGSLYDLGEGVKKDPKLAILWYKKALKRGDHRADFDLAEHYFWGHGVKRDWKKGVYLYYVAAEHNVASAQAMVGWFYGLWASRAKGAERADELTLAYAWLQLAVKNGDTQALKVINILKPYLTKAEIAAAATRIQLQPWVTYKSLTGAMDLDRSLHLDQGPNIE